MGHTNGESHIILTTAGTATGVLAAVLTANPHDFAAHYERLKQDREECIANTKQDKISSEQHRGRQLQIHKISDWIYKRLFEWVGLVKRFKIIR